MEKIQLRAILEILGRPPEHISTALQQLIEKIKKEKGIKLIDETHHAPIPIKDSPDLYTSFAEIMLELDDLNIVFGFLFQYMPANIEIISPENLKLTNQEMNVAVNHLAERMHQYDAITKKMIAERDAAMKKLFEVAPHLFKKKENVQSPNPQPVSESPKAEEPKKDKKDKSAKKKSKK